MQRTSAVTLTVVGCIGLVVGRFARTVFEHRDGVAPVVGWASTTGLLVGAVILGSLAWSTHQTLQNKKQSIAAHRGVRLLALAKASAVVGALFAGAYGGYALAFIDAFDTSMGRERVLRSAAAGVAGLLVMIAALLLERACQVPGDDDESGKGKPSRSGTDPTPA
ncbi:hypothetical protein BH09ACT10_BH09ACT10_27240 [soil metagenome]